jgi:hypothetical protein
MVKTETVINTTLFGLSRMGKSLPAFTFENGYEGEAAGMGMKRNSG